MCATSCSTARAGAATGLVYLRARMYDPSLGRFLQRDPFPGLIAAPGSLHRFAYVGNNPLRFTDPGGLSRGERDQNADDCTQTAGQAFFAPLARLLNQRGHAPSQHGLV